jgi:hypothetical protein
MGCSAIQEEESHQTSWLMLLLCIHKDLRFKSWPGDQRSSLEDFRGIVP